MQYEQAQLRLLVSLCRELQREAGRHPFFLSVRTAAEQVGVSPSHAATWLNGLVIDGILKRVRTGVLRTRKSSEYRYTGG
jgi:DNA-binding Lrp family transcriptional regulator